MTSPSGQPHIAGPYLAENLVLPKDIVTSKLAILANSGAGKSYTGMKLAELMLSMQAQVVVLDPVGIWYGLLSSANGQGPGFHVLILGGAHGHLALSPKAGAAVAAFIVETGVSVVLDLSDLLPDALHEFVTDFARALLLERRKKPAPMHLFWEEADNFSPQRMKGSSSYGMVLAVAKLLKEGRHAGIGWTLISQRSQDVDKVVLDLAETLIALRTGKGWKRVREWLTEKEVEVEAGLQKELVEMATGDAIVISPYLLKEKYRRIHVLRRITFDSSKTPELGEAHITPQLAEVDLSRIRATMDGFLRRSEEGGRPAAPDRGAADQEREQARLLVGRLRNVMFNMGRQLEVLVDAIARFEQSVRGPLEEARQISAVGADLERSLAEGIAPPRSSAPSEGADGAEATATLSARARDAAEARTDSNAKGRKKSLRPHSELSLCARRILAVFSWYGHNKPELDKATLGVLSIYAHSSGNFNNALGELRKADFIESGRGRSSYRIRPAGLARALQLVESPEPPGPHTLALARVAWMTKDSLSGTAKKILDVLLRETGTALTRQQVADRAQYSAGSGNFNNALGELNGLGLIEKTGQGQSATFRAARVLFE